MFAVEIHRGALKLKVVEVQGEATGGAERTEQGEAIR